jgi:hypothetical protein
MPVDPQTILHQGGVNMSEQNQNFENRNIVTAQEGASRQE